MENQVQEVQTFNPTEEMCQMRTKDSETRLPRDVHGVRKEVAELHQVFAGEGVGCTTSWWEGAGAIGRWDEAVAAVSPREKTEDIYSVMELKGVTWS